ncbi:laminin subunit gamma-2 [Cololabis saira]|uniref:laminin subunit gamma-2 n=1 Tax=Cololabis saira TaxID=129043 RepID=UPI002AD3C8B9|nr:laminin subunit gamma-2 [Cololabis saira]
MNKNGIFLLGILAAVCVAQVTATFFSHPRCRCHGRSRFCLWDSGGLRCLSCRGNSEGRHCERCRDGFYLAAGRSCEPCGCHPAGSTAATCDGSGRCSCRAGVTGPKCDRCRDGTLGPDGCTQSRQTREDSGSLSPPCFCYGHSSQCSPGSGYSIHRITSTFSTGPEGWTVTTAQGVAPDNVHFRWSPKHQDVEVISRSSLPTYLSAPESFLGNQLLSLGQNLSFSLRLDRGVRYPSTSDVILEGGGLRVAASLGNLRSVVPCGQKIRYSFRLDQEPAGRWRPQLSPGQFQKLLQNLTALRIRTTFGEKGRGYLDDVSLVSARPGPGTPAGWVQTCTCPRGYEGEFCQRCSAGFRRSVPADGAFGACEPGCDPNTADCYSADETPAERRCAPGLYRDPRNPEACTSCPCPAGGSCSLVPGAREPVCDRCPPGTAGPRCDVCTEGFHGDPSGSDGVARPCEPCSCNGHIDVGAAGSCDRGTGECLRCLNHTRGRHCEDCVRGFYHSRPSDACQACRCDPQGSESDQCDGSGRCRCRPGYEGRRCHRSSCPACFTPVKAKMEDYAARLQELETLYSDLDAGSTPGGGADMLAALRAVEELVENLQENAQELTDVEAGLQARLAALSRTRGAEAREVQNLAAAAADISRRQQENRAEVQDLETLLDTMRRDLGDAKTALRSADLPLSDEPQGPSALTSLAKTAAALADKHRTKAALVEQTADAALSDSEESLVLARTLLTRENGVKELIGDLRSMYGQTSARVKGLQDRGTRLGEEAADESKLADGMLRDIASMERRVPPPLEDERVAMVTRLDRAAQAVEDAVSGIQDLQDAAQPNRAAAEVLLADGTAAQQDYQKLLDRVNVAKGDTEDALRRITGNTGELDGALDGLRGFDQQIDDSKALAAAAVRRLPGINATVQNAVGNNAKTRSALDNVSKDYDGALESMNVLENLVDGLEKTFGSLPAQAGLVEATQLNGEVKDLQKRAGAAAGDLAAQLGEATQLEAEAEEAADGAQAAFNNARRTKDAVATTLRDVNNLLANINRGDAVDEQQLLRLEEALADAQKGVESGLRPRLQEVTEQEEARRRRLSRLDLDIDGLLADIANLEDVLAAVPRGCYNAPPIEEP